MDAYKVVLIIFLILLIIWILGKLFFTTNIVYDIMCDASVLAANLEMDNQSLFSKNKNIVTDFNDNSTTNFMLSVWFYIDDWENKISKEKNVLFMSNTPIANPAFDNPSDFMGISKKNCKNGADTGVTYKNLNIALDDYNNNLLIDIETQPADAGDATDSSYCYTRYLVKNISVQKWNCLTISVDTKILDVYLDGKLRNSFILPNIYNSSDLTNQNKMYLGHINEISPGFQGVITRIRYEPNSINPQEAYNIYKEGINSSLAKSLYDKYSMKVSFLEYNKEKGSFTI